MLIIVGYDFMILSVRQISDYYGQSGHVDNEPLSHVGRNNNNIKKHKKNESHLLMTFGIYFHVWKIVWLIVALESSEQHVQGVTIIVASDLFVYLLKRHSLDDQQIIYICIYQGISHVTIIT